MDDDAKCQRCKSAPAEAEHVCPYAYEIHEDESLCTCCESCASECADEI
jgi:hypothetical protein